MEQKGAGLNGRPIHNPNRRGICFCITPEEIGLFITIKVGNFANSPAGEVRANL